MGSQHYDQDHQRPRSNRPEGRRPGRSARRVLHLDAGPWSVSRGKLATRRGTLRASPVVRSDEATARLAHDQLRAACCWRAINPGKPRSLTVHCAAGPSQVGAPDYAPGAVFQAGHAGPIPVARSAPPTSQNGGLSRSWEGPPSAFVPLTPSGHRDHRSCHTVVAVLVGLVRTVVAAFNRLLTFYTYTAEHVRTYTHRDH
jgi:hypothetical protein